ncbi:glycosyltransferase family 2 protein [Neomicrococcus lactis]
MRARVQKPLFSVVIPTLQKSPDLNPLVEQCASHPLVAEVLVINNAPQSLNWDSPKVRVLQQDGNIYVNPAWNLGAREAQSRFLAIINDDVRFSDEVFDQAARVLDRGRFSMIGPSESCLNEHVGKKIGHRRGSLSTVPFGTLMFLRKDDYVPIPDDLLIWGGDHWLMLNQNRPIAKFVRTTIRTDMSTTTRAPAFQALYDEEARAIESHLKEVKRRKAWHWPAWIMLRTRMIANFIRKH